MIIRLALRNLIRLPWRTILYFLVVFFIVVAVTASIFVYVACENSKKLLDDAYIFVASLIPRSSGLSDDGTPMLSLRDLGYCLEGADILSYNVSISENESSIPGGENMFHLPETAEEEDAVPFWQELFGCNLVAVENLYLVYPFFTGDCTIVSGTGLTKDGYNGEKAEILIPWWMAEQYHISVGDTVVKRYYREDYDRYVFLESTVVGIYRSESQSLVYTEYPAYIPLATAELDYGIITSENISSTTDIQLERADFVLESRNDFDTFVRNAEKNGLNFQKADIIFNNSSYDVLSEEIYNIHIILIVIICVILFIGSGIVVFFTIYFHHSRKKEREILRALGMTQNGIFGMMATELVVIILLSAFLGFFSGRLTADFVCQSVNETVLAEASEAAVLRYSEKSGEIGTMPLERETKIEISLSGAMIYMPDVAINYSKTVGENEVGISLHTYYDLGPLDSILHNERTPVTVIGITDITWISTSISFEEVIESPNYSENIIYAYVGKETGYQIGDRINLGAFDKDEYTLLTNGGLDSTHIPKNETVLVIGTFEENKYCKGADILIRMEDYHRLFRKFSITDEEFFFERIGKIVKKET